MMKKMMCCRKVLVVLDDVDHIHQLEALAGELNWFKKGSVIIITTRDEQVLVAHRVKLICDICLLSQKEAICLFSRYAFGRELPIPGHEELSRQVVGYAAGLPLTIKVMGSFLCGKNELEWKDTLERLKTIPLKETLEKLELSYNGLEEDHKEIFLDVACILQDFPRYIAIQMLESCGFHARTALRVLEQKSLITILKNGRIGMHDHVEEMGRNIVRRLHPDEPSKHSRLWIYKEIEDILTNNLGDETTRGIKLQMGEIDPEIIMKGLGNMKKLRFLYVFSQNDESDRFHGDWKFDEVSAYFPNSLRFLFWDGYPFSCLPKTFRANNLVELEMPSCRIEQLWEGRETKVLDKLRFLKLDHSELKTIDLRLTPNLEMLDLRRCYDLVELHMPVRCPKLKSLNLSHSKLRALDLRLTPNLEMLILEGCKDLGDMPLPVRCPKLKAFDFSYSKLRRFDLQQTPNLETLDLGGCHDLVELYMLVVCVKLKYLNLSYSKLRNLHIDMSPNLETLMLEGCNDLVKHDLLIGCPQLRTLNLGYSKLNTLDLRLALNLETLHLRGCHNLIELHMPGECGKLESIDISVSKLITLDLRGISNLKSLSLVECVDLIELHLPIECRNLIYLKLILSKLRTLDLRRAQYLERLSLEKCDDLVVFNMPNECLKLTSLNLSLSKLRTIDLGGTPNLKTLSLTESYHLVELQALVGCLKNLEYLNLRGCLSFKITFFSEMESLEVGSLSMLQVIVKSLGICSLHHGKCLPKFQFECTVEEHVPSLMGNLHKLISVGLCACTNPKRFFRSICGFRRLTHLTIDGSIPPVPKDLERLQRLKFLTLSCGGFIYLPYSICMLKHLKYLKLRSCLLLEELPEDLVRLELLEDLIIRGCIRLQDIPNSICEMKHLQYFHLSYCTAVEKLPEELGRLKCLRELRIENTNITHLPQSIFWLKGLCIVGSRWRLQSYGFTSEIQTSERHTFCYIGDYNTDGSASQLNPTNDEVDDDGVPYSKKRRTDFGSLDVTHVVLPISEEVSRFLVTSEVGIPDDGYCWRKYGQRVLEGNPNPRSYYKCTSAGCTIRKHAERSFHDHRQVLVTYDGRHSHDIPIDQKNSGIDVIEGGISLTRLE